MTTTELIELLSNVEHGGVSGESREISLILPDGKYLSNFDIEVSSTGDGVAGAELTLAINRS